MFKNRGKQISPYFLLTKAKICQNKIDFIFLKMHQIYPKIWFKKLILLITSNAIHVQNKYFFPNIF